MSCCYNLHDQRGENVPQTEDSPTPPTTPILEIGTTLPVPYSHAGSPPATIKVEESGASSLVISPSSTNHGGSDVFSSSLIGEVLAFSLAGNGSEVPLSIIFGSLDVVMEKDENPNPWMQVTHKSHCSHSEMNTSKWHKTGAQDTPIHAAETLLILSQQELLHLQAENVQIDKNPEEDSFSALGIEYLGEGTSTGKGKVANPRNWGAIDLENEETDPNEQHQALAFWNSVKMGDTKSLQELYDMQHRFEQENPHRMNRVEANKALPKKVKLEEVYDQDEFKYLYKVTPPLPLDDAVQVTQATPAPSIKKEQKHSSVPLSDLMDCQIEDIVGG
ncbi:hypothetical protein EDD18DRAFT_1365370 [Armillaria luteobubalina]|uniref:Uncharacterized protein n=1 Tax=Armillaria luteobubalina TaxID=153913 RepID=A0AA39P519_9AGAR|nr:hypothetical protein EDD18DRAFT_1365370 [Armillaria luteobubalina]